MFFYDKYKINLIKLQVTFACVMGIYAIVHQELKVLVN